MATQNPDATLLQSLAGIRDELKQQGLKTQLETRAVYLGKNVRTFGGENSKRYREWVKDMERIGIQVEADAGRMRSLALQTLNGYAGDFMLRFLKEKQNPSWDEIKKALSDRFCDQSDVECARQLLAKLKQHRGEDVKNFEERILSMAEEAFPGENLATPLVQSRLLDVFVDGLRDESVMRKIIRERPKTLDQAVKTAKFEQQANRSFELRKRSNRNEEPMEVDTLSQKREQDRQIREQEKQIKQLQETVARLSVQSPQQLPPSAHFQPNFQPPPRPFPTRSGQMPIQSPFQWTSDGRPVCANCGCIGHTRKRCRQGNE